MSNEEALEFFSDFLSLLEKNGESEILGNKYCGSSRIAIEAIDKRIPKKPIVAEEKIVTFVGEQTREGYYCPECKEKIRKMVVSNKFCHNCGQAVDWKEKE